MVGGRRGGACVVLYPTHAEAPWSWLSCDCNTYAHVAHQEGMDECSNLTPLFERIFTRDLNRFGVFRISGPRVRMNAGRDSTSHANIDMTVGHVVVLRHGMQWR